MASSVDRCALSANWWGSKEGGRQSLMCWETDGTKHFTISWLGPGWPSTSVADCCLSGVLVLSFCRTAWPV